VQVGESSSRLRAAADFALRDASRDVLVQSVPPRRQFSVVTRRAGDAAAAAAVRRGDVIKRHPGGHWREGRRREPRNLPKRRNPKTHETATTLKTLRGRVRETPPESPGHPDPIRETPPRQPDPITRRPSRSYPKPSGANTRAPRSHAAAAALSNRHTEARRLNHQGSSSGYSRWQPWLAAAFPLAPRCRCLQMQANALRVP
jgi:hypothetical protein